MTDVKKIAGFRRVYFYNGKIFLQWENVKTDEDLKTVKPEDDTGVGRPYK